MKILISETTGLHLDSVSKLFEPFPVLRGALLIFAEEQEAIPMLENDAINVVISEVGASSLIFLNRILRANPDAKVLFYSNCVDPEKVAPLLKAGAQGFVIRNQGLLALPQAVIALLEGGAPLAPQVSRFLLTEYQRDCLASSLSFLTEREQQVFRCIEEGNSYKGISSELNISPNTVHTHVKNIYSKLEAVSKYDALQKARQLATV